MLPRKHFRPSTDAVWLQERPGGRDFSWTSSRLAADGSQLWVRRALMWRWRRVDLADLRSVRRGENQGVWWTLRDHHHGRATVEGADLNCRPFVEFVAPAIAAAVADPDTHTGHSVRVHLDEWCLPGGRRWFGRPPRPALMWTADLPKPPRPPSAGELESHRMRRELEREVARRAR